ncbi:MAG TPA: FAD-dependent oxidoreductase [Devosia sp.]|nr:FAD-dependent oxidoreductase [Devosia sp.]
MATVSTPDLCVIGAGASGLAVAEAARRLGASVTMVEKGAPGGSSLRSGALALKALAAAAERSALAISSPQFGVFPEAAPKVSFRRLHDHIAEVIAQEAPQAGAPRLAALGIDLVRGAGTFIDPRTVKAGDVEIRARRVVIATGARPLLPDIPGLYSVPYFTTDTIFDNTRKLTHLVVAGAGPMGIELALSYNRLGCEVTVIEPGRALAQVDPELAEIALRRLREEGVKLHEESAIVAVQQRSQGIGVVVRGRDEPITLDASHILVAASRVANIEELNLDAAKIRRSKSDPGALSLNASLRTTNPSVYAVGEAAGHAPLPHLSALEADLVVRAALLGQPSRYDPAAVPRLTLTDPPIAEIGLSEPMARARFRTGYRVVRASYAENDAARAERQGMGVVKLVIGRAGNILGAGIAGAGAAELAAIFALAIDLRLEARRLAELNAAHPSHAELVRVLGEAAGQGGAERRWMKRRFAISKLWR